MNGNEARKEIKDMKDSGKTIIHNSDMTRVHLIGSFTVDQLQAILRIMEYTD